MRKPIDNSPEARTKRLAELNRKESGSISSGGLFNILMDCNGIRTPRAHASGVQLAKSYIEKIIKVNAGKSDFIDSVCKQALTGWLSPKQAYFLVKFCEENNIQ